MKNSLVNLFNHFVVVESSPLSTPHFMRGYANPIPSGSNENPRNRQFNLFDVVESSSLSTPHFMRGYAKSDPLGINENPRHR